ncbi:MAG: DUF4332 domain-containing protein [Hyphomicrobium sp.]
MSLLFRILYAAHANGTHHKLALDALNHMERPDAEAWRRVFLKHAKLYLEGSKAPDTSFKDFKNHVLHVGESYWGGAPEKVEAWYGHTVAALREERWADAVYAAGVLSHYYTDPIHPFHTGQTEAENSIHRAVEWSINRSYNDLRAMGVERFANTTVTSHEGAHWLKEMTCDGAEFSHRYYEKLIAQYDFKRGAVRPEEGFDEVGRTVVAELLMYAADGFGHILDRAIGESGVTAPDVALTLETVMATLNIPAKWIEKKLSNAEDRRIVQAMYDELQATGKVEATLPEDDRIIRDLHKREVLDRAKEMQLDKRVVRIPDGDPAEARRGRRVLQAGKAVVAPAAVAGIAGTPAPSPATVAKAPRRIEIEAELAPEAYADAPPALRTLEPAPIEVPTRSFKGNAVTHLSPATATSQPAPAAVPPRREPVRGLEGLRTAMEQTPATQPAAHRVAAPPASERESERETSQRRFYLTAVDNLERAPSIGPKMAARFEALGIKTVADFLAHAPDDMAELLDDKRIDAETLTEWQDQAQLVMEIAGLRGTHAQLLTGAGYRAAQDVADADAVAFSADILKFATSDPGKRILREGNAPDIEKIRGWVSAAKLAMAA